MHKKMMKHFESWNTQRKVFSQDFQPETLETAEYWCFAGPGQL